jgi:DNA-binding NarL/FixJ family response regulator
LTPREREVAHLMASGHTNQQIAETLVLTRGTVANHVAHILDKLGASNRTQVAALVFLAQPERPQPNGPASNAAAD